MEFGLSTLTPRKPTNRDKSYTELYDETLEYATLAEEVGFDAVYTAEHHFWDDGNLPCPFELSAAIAARTETIDIGTGIIQAPLHHPLRLAESTAVVDLISGGRFQLGLANGQAGPQFEAFEVPLEERARRVEEAIEICRRAWNEGTHSFQGDITNYVDVRVEPTPAQNGGPPIYLGGYAKSALDRTATMADGYLGAVKYSKDVSRDIQSGRANASYELFLENLDYIAAKRDISEDSFTTGLIQYSFVAESDEKAWKAFLPAFAADRKKYAEIRGSPTAAEWDMRPSNWDVDEMSDNRREALRRGALVGDPETVISKLRQYEYDVPGDLHFIPILLYPDLEHSVQKRAIRLFGEEVIPAVSEC